MRTNSSERRREPWEIDAGLCDAPQAMGDVLAEVWEGVGWSAAGLGKVTPLRECGRPSTAAMASAGV